MYPVLSYEYGINTTIQATKHVTVQPFIQESRKLGFVKCTTIKVKIPLSKSRILTSLIDLGRNIMYNNNKLK